MVKKIAIIGARGFPDNFPGSSGIDTFISQLFPYLNKYKIKIYSRSWVKNKNSKTFSVPCIKNKYLDTGLYTLLSTPIALFHPSQIFWYQAPGSCLFLGLAKLFGKKTVVTLHGLDWQRQKWQFPLNRFFLQQLESFAVKNCDICTAVSADICQYVENIYHKKCLLTPPGPIISTKIPAKKIVSKFGLQPNSYILYLGRLVPEKRVDWLIKSFLKNSYLNSQFKLVIAGSLDNSQYCQSLKKMSAGHSNIIFTNYVSGQIKQELLSNCRLFVLPSNLEGNPISLNEAIGLHQNCLASDIQVHQSLAQQFSNLNLFHTNSFSDFHQKLASNLHQFSISSLKIKNQWPKTAQTFIKIFDCL